MAKGKQSVQSEVPSELPALVGQSFASSGYSRLASGGALTTTASKDARFNNLLKLPDPFGYNASGLVNGREMILLCRTAYRHFPVFRTAVDIMSDLACTPVHLKGGNKQSNDFFEAWMNRINIFHIEQQFFMECFKGGTMLFYRTDATLSNTEVLKLNQNYAAKTVDIPTKYTLLDAASVCLDGVAYDNPTYFKILSKFELEQLGKSDDEYDKETYKSLKKSINEYQKGGKEPYIELDPKRLHAIFYNKADYEPLAIPMGYCVLDDINLYLEFKKADAIIARTVEYVILKVTMGAEPEKGGVNPKALQALKDMFKNEKIGRVLVSDHTTQAEFVIPDLEKVLNPIKYEEVNKNIANGLLNIFFGEQKYADSVTKLRALSKKIQSAQELFIREFLNPEIKRISKQMNFKAYPTAVLEPVRIEDQTNAQRVYAQLLQLGVLSPKDGLELFETGLFPDFDTVETNQESYRQARDKGHFQPIQGGPFDQKQIAQENNKARLQQKSMSGPGGRPGGTKSKQTTKRVSQTGASYDESRFAVNLIAENTVKLHEAREAVAAEYKKVHGIKRLTANHKLAIDMVLAGVLEQEKPDNWATKASELISNNELIDINTEIVGEVEGIREEFEVDHDTAVVLYHSKIN